MSRVFVVTEADYIRRCPIPGTKYTQFHCWDVRTGESTTHDPHFGMWDQRCPAHKGENSTQYARAMNIPEYAAVLCEEGKTG